MQALKQSFILVAGLGYDNQVDGESLPTTNSDNFKYNGKNYIAAGFTDGNGNYKPTLREILKATSITNTLVIEDDKGLEFKIQQCKKIQ